MGGSKIFQRWPDNPLGRHRVRMAVREAGAGQLPCKEAVLSEYPDSAAPAPGCQERGPVLLALVATHRHTGLEVLARLRAEPSHIASSVGAAELRGTVVLASCNRFEIYCEVATARDTDAVFSALTAQVRERSGLLPPDALPSFVRYTGPAVAEHLFAVAAG
ncbi:hypothetical protein HER39_18150, partial [Arthrobacter deserti]|nr:hypothetical protein [Arthrobacter deserti]